MKRYNFYGKCLKCKRNYISPIWCQLCDPLEATKEWTSGNKEIDEYIKGFQIKVTEYEKMIEWIPFDRLTNLQKIKEKESEIIFMATWLDGIRIIKGDLIKDTQSRIKSCGVNLKILHGSQNSDFFIEKLKNYTQLEGNMIYGITQDTVTNQYIMIIPDEFSSRRNSSNGKCISCKHFNTSPAWCQSCDPWKSTQEWTSGNKEIDDFIKELQIKATEYEKVIEWIPFDRLINLQEIKEESDLVFMATWINGIRVIKGESGKYTQSHTVSCVDLMKLQTNTLEIIKNFKNHIQLEKYKIFGITQNTETGQYMIVFDFYSDKRKSINGICVYCKRYNTYPAWCQLCDPPKVTQGTSSGDKNIDDCIKEFQLKATAYEKVIEWIPFDRLENIKIIGKGGFGTVYSSIWLDGKRVIEGDNSVGYVRFRNKACEVALKTLPGPQMNSTTFLTEFINHMQCRLEGSELEIYGLTQDTNTGQYMMVLQYANRGNLYDFLTKYFRELTWQKKLKQLADISYDLSQIHEIGLIHNDFHSGNILLNQNIDGNIKSYIADLGLSRKQDEHESEGCVYGVIPYVAPEIFIGKEHTKKADIYGLGVIMAEVSSGIRPYHGLELNTNLALKICNGLRPEFAIGTPDCYIQLANQCMDSNPEKRPIAKDVYSKIIQWKTIMESENLIDKEELDIKEKFNDADSIIKKTSLKSLSTMLQNKCCSTLIDTKEIIKNFKASISIYSA